MLSNPVYRREQNNAEFEHLDTLITKLLQKICVAFAIFV